jgi:hypothetical protein
MLTRQKGSVGKYKVDYKLEHFYKDYKKESSNSLTKQQYSLFYKEIMAELMTVMIEKSTEIRIPSIGYFSVLSYKPALIKDGEINKRGLNPDWKKTWEYWYTKYKGKTQQEIVAISNKTLIYHENKHSQGLSYSFKWNNFTSQIKGKQGYKFIASTQYKKRVNQFVKDNPNHCYYGK